MQSSSELKELHDQLAQYKPGNMAEIIDKLAGGKDNLRVEIQKVRFNLRRVGYEVNGQVNFNVIHKKPPTENPRRLNDGADADTGL